MAVYGRQAVALPDALCAPRLACAWVFPALLALVVNACYSSPEVLDKRSDVRDAETARGESVEVPGGLNVGRAVYQSRGVVALDINSSAIQLGDEFSLVNETTDAVLIEQVQPRLTLIEDDASGWQLDGYSVTLRIYLLSPEFAQRFAPGVNSLRLNVSSADGEIGRNAKSMLILRDFPVFGEASGVFESGEQRAGGFEGSFVPFVNSVLTRKGKDLLVTGFGNIINR